MKKFITLSVLSTVFLVTACQEAGAASSSMVQREISHTLPPLRWIQTCIDFTHNMRKRPPLPAVGQLTYNMMMQACKSILSYEQHKAHQAYVESLEAVDTFFDMAMSNHRLGLVGEARDALAKGHRVEEQIREELERDPHQAIGTFASYFEYASHALDMANGHGNPHNQERDVKTHRPLPPHGWQWGHFSQNDIDGAWTSYHEQHYVASMEHTKELMHHSLVKPHQ